MDVPHASEYAIDDVVYVSYVSHGLVHQLLVRIEHMDGEHIEVRVADAVHWQHVDCAGATLEPEQQPRALAQDPADNLLIRLPRSAILCSYPVGDAAGDTKEPVYVLCTPTLVGRLAKLTVRSGVQGTIVGRVVRDLWRCDQWDRACVIALTPKAIEGRGLVSHRSDVVFSGSHCYYFGRGAARLETSNISDTHRGSIVSLRVRYARYLTEQVTRHFGGMKRHVVSAYRADMGGVAFTYSNCYLAPLNERGVQLTGVGTPGFLQPASLPDNDGDDDVRPRHPVKGDIIYGTPTTTSMLKPHPSGRETLLWVNATRHYPGLDAFLRYFAATTPGAVKETDLVASMLDGDGKPTVFSELMAGYYGIAADTDTHAFDEMMSTVCWEYNL